MGLKNLKMTTVRQHGLWGKGPGTWGLVQQKGPWTQTKQDVANEKQPPVPVLGNGLGFGGTLHAGHGDYKSITNPYTQNSRRAAPYPSRYAQRSLVATRPLGLNLRKPVPGERGRRHFLNEVEQPARPHLYDSPQEGSSAPVESPQVMENMAPVAVEPDMLKQEALSRLAIDVNSIIGHGTKGVIDFASGNFLGVGAHIGGAIGDLLHPVLNLATTGGKRDNRVDSHQITNYLSPYSQGISDTFVNYGSHFSEAYNGKGVEITGKRVKEKAVETFKHTPLYLDKQEMDFKKGIKYHARGITRGVDAMTGDILAARFGTL